ncbi:hypothetical protein [Salinimicrobium flavum]|uniref:Alpha/beta hydrolase n=1 Tax=Salinimicrobium flavum TaxID=1737065 RepID=A0ABW5IWI1_9FLAO
MRKILFFLLIAAQVSAQEMTLKKGIVIDSLKVSDTIDESFAIYLPTNFQNSTAMPTLFIFDSEGRGKSAAMLFRNAAERQGYVLVSSNNISPEADFKENVTIASRMIQSVSTLIPLDFRQLSTAGSMEGARVASSIPFLLENIHGVIAIGDQWMNYDLLEKRNGFIFIGVAGDEQFTSAGVKFTAELLRGMKLPTQVYSYEGGDDWPRPEIVSSVLGSLTLDAMRKKLRPEDPTLVEELYTADMNLVNARLSNSKVVEASDLLELMKDKYARLWDLDEIENRIRQIKRSRNYMDQSRQLEAVRVKERRLVEDFLYYFSEDIRTVNFENLGWWNYQKIQLDSLARKGGAEGKMATRIKGLINELAKTQRQELENQRSSLEQKLLADMIQTIFDPQAYSAYKDIISLSAQDNDFGTALFYLEEMLKHGYTNKEALYNIDGTLGLRLTPEYNLLIEKYLGSSRYYDKPEEKSLFPKQ